MAGHLVEVQADGFVEVGLGGKVAVEGVDVKIILVVAVIVVVDSVAMFAHVGI